MNNNELYANLYPYAVRILNDLFDPSERDYPACEVGLRSMAEDRYVRLHEENLLRQGYLEDTMSDGRIRLSLKGCRAMGIVLPENE